MRMRVLASLCLIALLTGCATEKFVPIPEIVEVPGPIQWREIPPSLTTPVSKITIPDALTYGDAIKAWSKDRAAIDKLNGQLLGIKSLNPDQE